MQALAATVKDMARTGERCGARGGSRVGEWRVKKRKSGCCLGTPSDEAFAAKFQPEKANLFWRDFLRFQFRARL
jgi:hypothetical protein